MCSMHGFSIYLFQAVRHAINVLNVSTRVSKYPPNAILRNANIDAQRANLTDSMNWLNKTVCSW